MKINNFIVVVSLVVLSSFAIDPLVGPGTDTVQFNRTNKNVLPNGLNMLLNNLGATNGTFSQSVRVGETNNPNPGSISIGTTNFTLIVKLTINTNGDFVLSDGTNTMMVLQKSSGYDGSTNKFLAADGHFYTNAVSSGVPSNPTDHFIPVRFSTNVFGDSFIQSGTNSIGDALLTIEPDWQFSRNFRGVTLWIEPYSSTTNYIPNAPLALYVENDVNTEDETQWPAHTGRSGNISAYFIAAPINTNTTSIGVFGAIDPAYYNYSAAVLGEIEESAISSTTTNFAVAGSVSLLLPFTSARKSVAIYGETPLQNLTSHDPYINESAVALFDSMDSGVPLIIGRTNNGTAVWTLDSFGQQIFGPGTSNVLYRSGTDIVYTNATAAIHLIGSTASGFLSTGTGAFGVIADQSTLYLANSDRSIVFSSSQILPNQTDIDLGGAGVEFLNGWFTNVVIKSKLVWNGSTNTVFDLAGKGSPEGSIIAAPGSTYRNFSGGTTNTFWVKESGGGNTGWINK